MAWFKPWTWGDKMVDNVFDKSEGLLVKAGRWIDGQQFTDQEKAEDQRDLRKGVIAYAIASMGENSERSKARRDIAKMWIKVQLWLVLFCAITIPLNESISDKYFALATSYLMMGGTGAIITFFFGNYMVTRYNETKK